MAAEDDTYIAAVAEIKSKFPRLAGYVKVASPTSRKYNCVAFAAGDATRWWWPDTLGMAYWPERCVRQATLPAFQMVFESLGYSLCDDGFYDACKDKIAVFHKDTIPTHAARLLHPHGRWASKLGQSYDIEHLVDGVCGED